MLLLKFGNLALVFYTFHCIVVQIILEDGLKNTALQLKENYCTYEVLGCKLYCGKEQLDIYNIYKLQYSQRHLVTHAMKEF